MITRFIVWNIWRKLYSFGSWYKFKVLIGLAKSGTFEWEMYEYEATHEKPKFNLTILISILGALFAGIIFVALIGAIILSSLAGAAGYDDSEVKSLVEVAEPMAVDAEVRSIATIPEPVFEEEVEYLDVPLSTDLQDHIFEVCEANGVDPLLVVAMIENESRYNERVIGDNGRSYGLMQIQPRWHYSRMRELGCTDLLDPYQNITVGVDYISELLSQGKSLEWTLMAYNGGPSYANRKAAAGVVSDYVRKVLSIKEGLE